MLSPLDAPMSIFHFFGVFTGLRGGGGHFIICFRGWDNNITAQRHGKSPTVANKDDTHEPFLLKPLIYQRNISLPGKYEVGFSYTEDNLPRMGSTRQILVKINRQTRHVPGGRGLSSGVPANHRCCQMSNVANRVM